MSVRILQGDCRDVLKTLPDASVDSIVTDPPYGLTQNKKGGSGVASVNLDSPYGRSRIGTGNGSGGFMGMKWDSTVPPVEVWAECLRVLKPGGHLLAFAATRTQHRMACRIEDVGFEIRDMIAWVYGSGFPKSHNLHGEWEGWGTALKPALEPITVARKPIVGTVSVNVAAHGTGAFNIDGCRVHAEDAQGGEYTVKRVDHGATLEKTGGNWRPDHLDAPLYRGETKLGRWPANLIHDGSDEVMVAFPDVPGQIADVSKNADRRKTQNVYGAMRCGRADEPSAESENQGAVGFKMKPGARRNDAGSAARFFYCAKASRSERGDGNNHPTVKPIDLMCWLVRLVTPSGGVVLDPFFGSGTTGIAALREGVDCIGIDDNTEYIEIARRRLRADAGMFAEVA